MPCDCCPTDLHHAVWRVMDRIDAPIPLPSKDDVREMLGDVLITFTPDGDEPITPLFRAVIEAFTAACGGETVQATSQRLQVALDASHAADQRNAANDPNDDAGLSWP